MMWVKFASGASGFLNVTHVAEFRVITVSSDSHLIEARMSDGTARVLDNVGYPTAAEALEAIRNLVSGVADAAG